MYKYLYFLENYCSEIKGFIPTRAVKDVKPFFLNHTTRRSFTLLNDNCCDLSLLFGPFLTAVKLVG